MIHKVLFKDIPALCSCNKLSILNYMLNLVSIHMEENNKHA